MPSIRRASQYDHFIETLGKRYSAWYAGHHINGSDVMLVSRMSWRLSGSAHGSCKSRFISSGYLSKSAQAICVGAGRIAVLGLPLWHTYMFRPNQTLSDR